MKLLHIVLLIGVACFIYTTVDARIQMIDNPQIPQYHNDNTKRIDDTQYATRERPIEMFKPTYILSLILIPIPLAILFFRKIDNKK